MEEKTYKFLYTFFLVYFLLHFKFQVAFSQGDGVILIQSNFQALRAIKHEFIDFKGVLRGWNDTDFRACSGGWVGIKCVNGQVISIQLPCKTLGGRISEKIGLLRSLRKISLHDNLLSGPIPFSLGSLLNLRGVYLFNNRLSGSIPGSISNCWSLQALDLSNNSLSGPIPSLANSTRLYRLNLSYNSLSGSIPISPVSSKSLMFLSLQHNNLSGEIPISLSKLGLLEEISLGYNQFFGIIRRELGWLRNLRLLDLSHNNLNGSFPSSFTNLSSLVSLNLETNRLNNPIPETLDRLKNLSILNLRNNHFDGEIPATIGNISGINFVDLSGNNFTGEIPVSLGNLVSLTFFNVSYNNLSGSVPSVLLKKFNSSSFIGNIQLCEINPSTPCPSSPPEPLPSRSLAPGLLPVKLKKHQRKISTKDIILISAGAILVLLLLLCCILLACLMRKKVASKKKDGKTTKMAAEKVVSGIEVGSGGEAGGKLVHFDGPFVFTADDLLCATAEIVRKSAYGTAYKATLEDGHEVAVKRLREKNTKGLKEFESEVSALGKFRHPNLLSLRAYYLGPKGEKLLVYDHMTQGTLSSFLHAPGPETVIDWPTRIKIAIGITHGLNYIHTQENQVHGNLTSSNILLDEQTNAHIADYSLSRLMTPNANTNMIEATAGTQGYNAPELVKTKRATTKSDIYSLGVIILELLTGKSPGEAMDGMDLPQWVASIVKEEWTNEVFDLELTRDAPAITDELLNTLKLALHCVDPSAAARPDAQQVIQQLEDIKPELAADSGSGDDGADKVESTNE